MRTNRPALDFFARFATGEEEGEEWVGGVEARGSVDEGGHSSNPTRLGDDGKLPPSPADVGTGRREGWVIPAVTSLLSRSRDGTLA